MQVLEDPNTGTGKLYVEREEFVTIWFALHANKEKLEAELFKMYVRDRNGRTVTQITQLYVHNYGDRKEAFLEQNAIYDSLAKVTAMLASMADTAKKWELI